MQRQTQLANDLWPLLLPRIQAMITASANGGGSGSGAVNLAAHDLGGSLHKGTLRSDQAPQFLLTDGTRSLAGSLAVDAGVTIDGVDISAHAADINAHHAKLHAITDAANHSVTGSQYQIVGLTAVNTLGLLTPSSSPAANAIVKTDAGSMVTFVDVTVTSDLFVTGYLDFGTNTMYEDASYLQVAGSKAVRFGQNIGNANWTVYNAGGALFSGNVDVTSGGDLTVAGSGFYAGVNVLFADSSGGNVGILCAPDPQFALDVNGPARATYFIGPHAIQLKDALLIAHFDGPEHGPYGEPNGHFGQVATITGDVVHRFGKFGKAIEISEAVTNIASNPSFETNITGWVDYASGSAAGTRTRTDEEAWDGYYSYRLDKTGGASGDRWGTRLQYSVTNGTSYSLTVRVKLVDAVGVTGGVVQFRTETNVNAQFVTYSTADGEWTELALRTTATATGTANAYVWIANCTSAIVYIDAVQVTVTGGERPFFAGTRAAGQLTYSALPIKWTQCTIMAWVWAEVAANDRGRNLRIAELRYDGSNRYNIYLDSTASRLAAYCVGGGASVSPSGTTAVTPKTWHHVALTVSGSTVSLYLDGIQESTGTLSGTATGAATAYVGTYAAGEHFNGLIDDFAIVNRALTAQEVSAVYESNAPVFAESSVWNFRATPRGLVWADDEGLWMRDVSGNSVLGVYGGEAASKSWGGFNMAVGDLVLGRNAVGSSAILWDQNAGTFGFYGAGSGTAQVEIATDGKLTAGGGKVKLDSTGFHALNASAVATIDINEQGIYLGDGGARTTIGNWSSGNRIRAYNVGEVYEATPETYLDDSYISRTLYPLVIRGIRQGNDAALIELAAVQSSDGTGAKIIIGEGFRLKDYYGTPYSTNRVVHAKATDIILESTNLQLRGLTTSAAAVGAYSGKIRIQIAGTNYYIPYYAS